MAQVDPVCVKKKGVKTIDMNTITLAWPRP